MELLKVIVLTSVVVLNLKSSNADPVPQYRFLGDDSFQPYINQQEYNGPDKEFGVPPLPGRYGLPNQFNPADSYNYYGYPNGGAGSSQQFLPLAAFPQFNDNFDTSFRNIDSDASVNRAKASASAAAAISDSDSSAAEASSA